MAKIITPLTAKQTKDAKPKNKQYKLYDGSGLILCVYTSGRKVWRFDYVDSNKKRKTYTIGNADLISLQDARKTRDKLRAKIEVGGEISTSINNSFESVFTQWFSRWENTVSPQHSKRAMSAMDLDVFKSIGNMDVSKIKPKDIVRSLSGMEARGSLEQLIKIKSIIKMCFDFAVARGLCEYNPVIMVSNAAFKKRAPQNQRSLDAREIYRLHEFFKNERFGLSVRLCTEFVLRTLTRVSESAHAKWSEIDLGETILTIPKIRMKSRREHSIPYSTQCAKILDEIGAISSHIDYIFPNYSLSSHMSRDYPLVALKRSNIDTSMHGLRHLASTILNESGLFRYDVIEACLAHQDKNSIRATYNKAQYIEERRELLQWWSDFIDRCDTEKGNLDALRELKII